MVDFMLATVAFGAAGLLYWWARELEGRPRGLARTAVLIGGGLIVIAAALGVVRIASLFPNLLVTILRALGITSAGLLLYAFAVFAFLRAVPAFNPSRRRLIAAAAATVPVTLGATAYIRRDDVRLVEIDLPIANLPSDLNGLRIVQLSDLHLSPLVDESLIARAVDMANATRPSLAVVTGDLITSERDPLDACLRQLARLRADSGVWGCMGNHETYAKAEEYTEREGNRLGIRFLRGRAEQLRFGTSVLNLAGVDYQPRALPYLTGAEKLCVDGACNLLLSHNPDVFRVAAEKGYQAMLAGHTHGGQINFEILDSQINAARFFTPFVYGSYRESGSSLYVTRGVGTIGIPARWGAPPEVAVIKLCAISS